VSPNWKWRSATLPRASVTLKRSGESLRTFASFRELLKAVPDDHIAKLDKAIQRVAKSQRQVEAIIDRQNERLAANADLIAQALELLSRPIR
jgi:hypothetical protein